MTMEMTVVRSREEQDMCKAVQEAVDLAIVIIQSNDLLH